MPLSKIIDIKGTQVKITAHELIGSHEARLQTRAVELSNNKPLAFASVDGDFVKYVASLLGEDPYELLGKFAEHKASQVL